MSKSLAAIVFLVASPALSDPLDHSSPGPQSIHDEPGPTALPFAAAASSTTAEGRDGAPVAAHTRWHEPSLESGIGVDFALGAGVSGFTSKMMRDTITSPVSGLWDARMSIGTHVPIGIDISYVGTAANVRTLGGTPNGTLVGATFEVALRYTVLPRAPVTPYLFGGAGWQRYDLNNVRLATADSGMQQADSILEIPMGAGVALRTANGFTVDARGTFRAQATDSNMVVDASSGGHAKLHTWEASTLLGYEF